MATGRGQCVFGATFKGNTIDYRTNEDVLQSLPERPGVWKLMYQSPVYLPEAGWLCM